MITVAQVSAALDAASDLELTVAESINQAGLADGYYGSRAASTDADYLRGYLEGAAMRGAELATVGR